jgi:aspartyl-tRNA(Asn)/glutamyl-tRNA(Gln) amidotransferase subunit A
MKTRISVRSKIHGIKPLFRRLVRRFCCRDRSSPDTAATGTDTGGSIRQPAAFCGITGIKPTYSSVSRYGMIAFASSLDQGGPMAQTAEDCGLLLNAMVGFDEKDSTSLDRKPEDFNRDLNKSIQGLRIGVPKEFFGEVWRRM